MIVRTNGNKFGNSKVALTLIGHGCKGSVDENDPFYYRDVYANPIDTEALIVLHTMSAEDEWSRYGYSSTLEIEYLIIDYFN